jgi:uncharacterized protein (TIGR00290 family)
MLKKIALSWSGGKDAAMALHVLQNGRAFETVALLTSVTDDYNRISMHGVREELLDAQAESAGIALKKIRIPRQCSDAQYREAMKRACSELKRSGVEHIAFGDLFLEDVRKYREENCSKAGMTAVFPLWRRDTKMLAREFIADGFRAIISCVDSKQIDGQFAGREYDSRFLNDLGDNADVCGENGEFHSFVYDGPVFGRPVRFAKGEIVLKRKRFYYCDLLPEKPPTVRVSSHT